MLPRLTSCCHCINLKIGTLIIGWLSVVLSCLNILSMMKEIFQMGEIDAATHDVNPECDAQCMEGVHKAVLGVGLFSIILDCVVIALSSLLIHGVNKNRPKLLTPFIVYLYVAIALLLLALLVGVVLLATIPIAATIYATVLIVLAAISTYFSMVVKAYQLELRESQGNAPMRLEEEGSQYAVKF